MGERSVTEVASYPEPHAPFVRRPADGRDVTTVDDVTVVATRRQVLGPWQPGEVDGWLVVIPVLVVVERRSEHEHRIGGRLAHDDPPGRERRAVAGAFDVVHERFVEPSGAHERRVQRVDVAVVADGPARRGECLRDDETAEHVPAPRFGRAFEPVAVECGEREALVQRCAHGARGQRPSGR